MRIVSGGSVVAGIFDWQVYFDFAANVKSPRAAFAGGAKVGRCSMMG